MSARPHETTTAVTGRIFMKFHIWDFFEKFVEKLMPLKTNKTNGHFS
jgi:hypothetical protein